MTNEERFRYYLIRAEQVQQRIENIEQTTQAKFEADPTRNQGHGALKDTTDDLGKNYVYRGLVGRRTMYQAYVQMYGLAAILDALGARNGKDG